MKIHYVEIDGLHDLHLSQREPFQQSATASPVNVNTSTDGSDTLMVDSGTLKIGDGTSMVDGCTLSVDRVTLRPVMTPCLSVAAP
jgi:hypothetical protein